MVLNSKIKSQYFRTNMCIQFGLLDLTYCAGAKLKIKMRRHHPGKITYEFQVPPFCWCLQMRHRNMFLSHLLN